MRTTRARIVGRRTTPRRGFTLVELIVVISIIALLLALLVPAVLGVIQPANAAQVKTEITQLESAIADFKTIYGTVPPSSITLTEDPSTTPWTADAKAKLRGIFGTKISFATANDFDGDGTAGENYTLTGEQCLLFFLGGPVVDEGGTLVPKGFSKNPSNPFETTTSNRNGPFFEIDTSRVHVDAAGEYPHYDAPNEYGEYVYVHSDDYSASVKAYKQTTSTYWNPKTFQIICSGLDGDIGTGTLNPIYDPDNKDSLPEADRDNITNFAPGELAN